QVKSECRMSRQETERYQTEDSEQNDLSECQRLGLSTPATLRRGRNPASTNHCHDGVHTGGHCGIGITGPDSGNNHIVNHTYRCCIGNDGFESIADLEPKLAIACHDEQNEPVVDTLSSHFPFLERAYGPILDRSIACRL